MKLQLKNINKTFYNKDQDKQVLNIEDVSFEGNKLIGILGQSGAGKSTLLNILGCLDYSFSGSYEIAVDKQNLRIEGFNKKDKKKLDKIRINNFSFVFQKYNLINKMTVFENVMMPLKYQRKMKYAKNIDDVLEKLNIFDLKYQKVETLSGGEQQRVAVARALIVEAPFILADEPTGALDYDNSINLMDLLKSVTKDFNKMVIIVTHNRSLLSYFDEVYEVIKGKVVKK